MGSLINLIYHLNQSSPFRAPFVWPTDKSQNIQHQLKRWRNRGGEQQRQERQKMQAVKCFMNSIKQVRALCTNSFNDSLHHLWFYSFLVNRLTWTAKKLVKNNSTLDHGNRIMSLQISFAWSSLMMIGACIFHQGCVEAMNKTACLVQGSRF